MPELSKNYEPRLIEDKWYQHWNKQGYFNSQPDERPAYTIVSPPPNITGVLHMGHALNNTVQDVLIRRAKSKGFNTCWVPGTDHASIATEAKVVGMLKEKGIDKNQITRPEFLQHAWEWKEKYGGIILEQLKKLGCSLDWNRVNFTLDPAYYEAVIGVFNDLYRKGQIYRGVKMINWDPQALTALSDEEVIHKETNSKLTYIRYRLDTNTEEYITIATVRPETILGDTAICVHPEDTRYQHLKGKYAFVPLINRRIPIIFDDYIDIEFGTGALKVTPAHDINDYNLGQKHQLAIIDILNDNGTLNEKAEIFIGEDRFKVRKSIIQDLETAGNLVKQEDYKNQVGVSERTGAVIEPKLSMQWWCNMEQMVTPALQAVMEEEIKFFPPKFKNLYRHWMGNIKDWCISRQLWWGQRIPAWYDKEGNIYVGNNEIEAFEAYREKNTNGKAEDLRQDEDVLDTWFSSWLWPLQVFGWYQNNDNEQLKYYYPTQTLVTGPDIIFFWVARMVMAGYEYQNNKPFDQVYFTGIIRDKQGRKMSKQLGNSPDLLQLIDDFGADVVRFSVLISSPAGNDILYDEAFLEQGRNFTNKIWNALKLVKMWEKRQTVSTTTEGNIPFACVWMEERINQVKTQLEGCFNEFRLSEALKTIYSLIWDDYCSWYLEWIKPLPDQNIDAVVYHKSIALFEELLQLLHPFMPFITEELFHLLKEQTTDLMALPLTESTPINQEVLAQGEILKNVITAVRDVRNKNNIKPKEIISLFIDSNKKDFYLTIESIIKRQLNADTITMHQPDNEQCIAIVVGTEKIFIQSHAVIDIPAQLEKMEEELKYLEGFLTSVDKKLSNERFIQNAKQAVIDIELQKKADALEKIEVLKSSIQQLKS